LAQAILIQKRQDKTAYSPLRLHRVVSCCNLSPDAMAMKISCFALCLSVGAATELTKDTWDAAVAGKSVFVKFQAPW